MNSQRGDDRQHQQHKTSADRPASLRRRCGGKAVDRRLRSAPRNSRGCCVVTAVGPQGVSQIRGEMALHKADTGAIMSDAQERHREPGGARAGTAAVGTPGHSAGR